MINDCFWILAGGGVRGTAYVGVLKALKELDIKMTGIAGSSAGAVIASLIAVGYTHEEIKKLLYGINYQLFKDLYIPLGKDFGFFKGDEVYNWLKKNIERKYYGEAKPPDAPPVRFKDVDCELVIIAADVSYTCFKEYNKIKTPDIEIAHAVRASISLPGFFKPVWENDRCLVDGDVINNFPLWKIESDIISHTNSKILEFRLESPEKPREINNVFDYFNAIIDTIYNIATDMLYTEFGDNDQFEIIRIDTGKTKVIDFGISNNEKSKLIDSGYASVHKYFDYDYREKRKKVIQTYDKIKTRLQDLQKYVSKNKIPESLLCIGKLSLYISENKDIVHKCLYNEFLDFQNCFQNSLLTISFFNLRLLRDRKEIISRIEKLLARIDKAEKQT